ncbi:protein GFS12 isoform X1 [Typha latifolia]|uniref:protein GFS12 isoform X1 n=1 Tax=Typha latifolia TaxID=4733 RepID=UPI003C2ED4E8
MGTVTPCFECLDRRIRSEFSDEVVFRYGVSDSPLPFGSSAVVEIYVSREVVDTTSYDVSGQFMLVGLSVNKERFADADDGYSTLENGLVTLVNGLQGKDSITPLEQGQYQRELDVGIQADKTSSSCERETLEAVDHGGLSISYCEHPSCFRMISALTPVPYIGRISYIAIRDVVSKFLAGSIEDDVISSINLLAEGKINRVYGVNFLNLIGFSTFDGTNLTGTVRHPNICPILCLLESRDSRYLLQPKFQYTLENVMQYSPKALRSDWHIRLFMYQILSALAYIHGLGASHGNIRPSTILLTDSCWPLLSIGDMFLVRCNFRSAKSASSGKPCCLMDYCPCQTIYSDLKLSLSIDWPSDFKRWWTGEMSNYEYLLVLNKLAGRRWGDHTFHTVMPWVIDFNVKPDENSTAGWRDLSKSKWRLAKGDEQLDFTYSTSEFPHHVSDECLSELAVCSYKARRLPLNILRSAVRSVYEPNEYPSSMQRLYQWTPDECIPEFYTDPRIFVSRHSEMSDLAVPSWAASPEEFIILHRDALESVHVSRQIHHWIDITFGYKLSGQASIEAKNVMLPTSDPSMPKSIGRRQLFTRPHPIRCGVTTHSRYHHDEASCARCQERVHESKAAANMGSDIISPLHFAPKDNLISETSYMEDIEEATLFSENSNCLNPIYSYRESSAENFSSLEYLKNKHLDKEVLEQLDGAPSVLSDFDFGCLLEYFEADDSLSMGFQEILLWRQKSSALGISSQEQADDIFAVGCILAELYLERPLFDPVSLAAYKETGIVPGVLQELPSHVALLVEASIDKDWKRRPSAKSFLESPYFPPTVRSAYIFLAPLQLLSKSGYRLQYVAKLASEGALKAMGTFAAEMCAPHCLRLIASAASDVETESAMHVLKEFLKCLSMQAIKALILPIIQKILQAEYSLMKVSLLQVSFVRDLWKKLGKQMYLEKVHSLIVQNLCNSPNKISASAASVVLIGSSDELGIPITVHQTVLPLIHSFGKGLSADGIDALVRIGTLLGESFIVKQLLPLVRNVVLSSINISQMNKPEPQQSWNVLTLIDSLSTLDCLVSVLPVEVILKELIQDQVCLHVKVLRQIQLDLRVTQVAATTLVALSQRIGPDLTSLYVLPQLIELFAELAFSQVASSEFGPSLRSSKISKLKLDEDVKIEDRKDIVLLLYPSLASIIGIEKLRQCCSTWFLLEQILQRRHNWKWESSGETSRSVDIMNPQRVHFIKYSSSDYNPAKLLLNGVGWSIPQSQGVKSGLTVTNGKQLNDREQVASINNSVISNFGNQEPWFWFPGPDADLEGPDFLGRGGGQKDEVPWKIKASVLYSARAHPGALRTLAVCHDECTIFTGGVGPGFKGSVQKWELPKVNCISGYYGHDEVVNAISILSVSGRVASCDGTIHIWNGQTGKLIAVYADSSTNSPLQTTAKVTTEQTSMLMPNALSGGMLSNAFSGSLYTCMHYLESDEKLIAGMGNGSLRFIDVVQDRKLHLWKSDSAEYSFSSLVSAICPCGSSSSWIVAGLSSGQCRLLDARSGNIIAFWRAHDGYITKLASLEDHLLVSSSLDKTLRVWDLRGNLATQSNIFRGHSDGISSFSLWGQDVISVSGHKIALTSLSRSTSEGGQQRLFPQKLYSADRGTRNLSVLSTISVLPFSRLLLVGTEDGYLKICC